MGVSGITTEELKELIKSCLSNIEVEIQNRTGSYVNIGESTITDILMKVYGNDIYKTYETFYKEFIK